MQGDVFAVLEHMTSRKIDTTSLKNILLVDKKGSERAASHRIMIDRQNSVIGTTHSTKNKSSSNTVS